MPRATAKCILARLEIQRQAFHLSLNRLDGEYFCLAIRGASGGQMNLAGSGFSLPSPPGAAAESCYARPAPPLGQAKPAPAPDLQPPLLLAHPAPQPRAKGIAALASFGKVSAALGVRPARVAAERSGVGGLCFWPAANVISAAVQVEQRSRSFLGCRCAVPRAEKQPAPLRRASLPGACGLPGPVLSAKLITAAGSGEREPSSGRRRSPRRRPSP